MLSACQLHVVMHAVAVHNISMRSQCMQSLGM